MVYTEQTVGIFIQDIYGNLYTDAEWDGTQTDNGIAIITENCNFVMALSEYQNVSWGGYNVDIDTLYNYTDRSEAVTDFDGEGNTAKIVETIGPTTDETGRIGSSARDCSNYVFNNGQTGYLGSAGEWEAVRENLTKIKELLYIFSYDIGSDYWTSTEYSAARAWAVWLNTNGGVTYNDKSINFYSRPFAPLISPDDIKSFKLNDNFRGTYQFLNGITWRQFASSQWNVIAGKEWSMDKLINIDEGDNIVQAGTRSINNGTRWITPDEVISSDGYYSAGPI